MFQFEHPQYLYVLEVIPLLAAFFIIARQAKRRLLRKFGNTKLVAQLTPYMSRYKPTVKFFLLLFALTAIIVGAANPQWGVKRDKMKRKGIDVFIALDVSNSMLAEDVAPNRLERAKKFAENLIAEFRGDRVGFIIFAGNAYLQVPLTTDYAALSLFIKSANPDLVPMQGTAIGDAVSLAYRSFAPENKKHKALIIISDGESHDIEAPAIVKKAHEDGLLVFTVAVGSKEGGLIPEFVGGRRDFKRDMSGNPVRSKTDEEALRELAKMGEGGFFTLNANSELIREALRQRISSMEKREYEQNSFSEYASYFQYFIGLALLLMVVEFLISFRRKKPLVDRDLFQV